MSKKREKEEQTLDEKLKIAIVQKEEEPYKVPDNWVWTNWGEIADITSSRRVLQKDWQKEGIPFYRTREIVALAKNQLFSNELFISQEHYDKLAKEYQMPKVGDLMVTGIGTIGICYLVKENDCFYYKDASVLCVSKKGNISSEYLKYLMSSNFMVEQIKKNSAGTTVDSLTISKYKTYKLPLPPIDEQKRIVNKLDYFFDKIQKVKEIIEEVKEKNEARKESILSKAFTGELTAKWRANNIHSAKELLSKINDEKLSNWEQECQKAEAEGRKKPSKPKLKSIDEMIVPNDEIPYEIPNNWVWTRLEDISYNFQVGLVKSALEQSEDKEYKYLKMNNITNDGKLTLDQLVCVDATLEEYEKFKLKKGDFLFNTRNSYELVGKNTIFDLEEDYLYNNNILKINFYEGINSKVISYYLNSPMGRDRLTEIKSGTTNVSAIYAKDLKKVTVPLPPIEEQKEIVRILDNIFTKENLINELISLEDKIQALEKSILSKAFRGELGTNSKDDIEAMELLKEIL